MWQIAVKIRELDWCDPTFLRLSELLRRNPRVYQSSTSFPLSKDTATWQRASKRRRRHSPRKEEHFFSKVTMSRCSLRCERGKKKENKEESRGEIQLSPPRLPWEAKRRRGSKTLWCNNSPGCSARDTSSWPIFTTVPREYRYLPQPKRQKPSNKQDKWI